MGPNGIFTVFLAYWVATGLQDTYLKVQHLRCMRHAESNAYTT